VTIARLDVSQKPWNFNVIELVNASTK
jgi:hypothetical protein